MPRARLTWYAEVVIPQKLCEKMDQMKMSMIRELEKKLIDKELAKICTQKLKKLDLVGEWLVELWFFEILEDRKDFATGYNIEAQGINVWRAEWVYTAVPSRVLAMDEKIVKITKTRKKINLDRLTFFVEAYFTITEED